MRKLGPLESLRTYDDETWPLRGRVVSRWSLGFGHWSLVISAPTPDPTLFDLRIEPRVLNRFDHRAGFEIAFDDEVDLLRLHRVRFHAVDALDRFDDRVRAAAAAVVDVRHRELLDLAVRRS